MLQAIDFEWVSEQLNHWALQEEMKKVEAYKEDHYDSH
jgi:hypothetical protein